MYTAIIDRDSTHVDIVDMDSDSVRPRTKTQDGRQKHRQET